MTEIPATPGAIPAGHPWARRIHDGTLAFTASRWAPWLAFLSVVTLAAVLNLWDLSGNGYGNTFYAAAARSMTLSWKNFFFGSFDPGGFITVDKPPVFLWMGALSARIFAYSSWAILAPSAIAGTASVALIWLIVRRYFGVLAATIAGVVLALTPISVAVDRLNLPEPFYILALVGAAGALLRSLDSRRWWWWTALAGALVGIAFNTKMLAGWIPGPAFALALVIGNGTTWRLSLRRILARLAVLAAVTFIVSASWMVVVDAWPASSRPYIGGSTNNTVSNLAFDYNGFGRVDGQSGRPGGGARPGNGGAFTRPNGGRPNGSGANGRFTPGGGQGGASGGTNGRGFTPGGGGNSFTPGGGQGGNGGPTGGNPFNRGGGGGGPAGGNATGAGGIIAGSPGFLRMLDDANGQQIAWFLPFALLGSLLSLWYWRKDRVRRAAVIVFAGWVLLFAGVFSYAQGTYHSYYTSAMAPGIAALVGMTVAAMPGLLKQSRHWLAAIGAIAAVTILVQLDISGRFPNFLNEPRPYAVAVLAVGAAVVVASVFLLRRVRPAAGLTVMLAGLLLIPAVWSGYETTHASTNTTLPQAGPRQGAAGRTFGSSAFDDGTASLAAWLQAQHQPGVRWDLAVTSAQNASTLIAEYNLSVMAIGGFLGTDPTITPTQFADLVQQGEVRYVLTTGGFGGAFPGLRGGQLFGQGGANRNGSGLSNGFPGAGGTNGGGAASPGSGFFGAGGSNVSPNRFAGSTANSDAKGASSIMAAVESACTQVASSDLPTQYQGSLYDCSGAANKIRAAATSTS